MAWGCIKKNQIFHTATSSCYFTYQTSFCGWSRVVRCNVSKLYFSSAACWSTMKRSEFNRAIMKPKLNWPTTSIYVNNRKSFIRRHPCAYSMVKYLFKVRLAYLATEFRLGSLCIVRAHSGHEHFVLSLGGRGIGKR